MSVPRLVAFARRTRGGAGLIMQDRRVSLRPARVLYRLALLLKQKGHPFGCPFCFNKSARRGSNPRPPPWQGGAPPLSHSRIYDVATATIDILHKERSIVNRFFIICKNSKSNSFYSEFSKNNCVSNIFLVHFCCMLELGNFTTRNKRNGRRGVSAV